MLLSIFQSIFNNPSENCISAHLSFSFKTAPDTAVAHAAVPQALVRPAPLSQTFAIICFLFFIVANVMLH